MNPFVHGHEFMEPAQLQMWSTMLATDYKLFTDALGGRIFGWGDERGSAFSENFRDCVDGRTALSMFEAMIEVDLAPLLSAVRCPALVVRARDMDWGADASSRRFAAALPDAQIVIVDSQAVSGATPEVRIAVGAFFGEDWRDPEPAAPPRPPRGPCRSPSSARSCSRTSSATRR